MKKLFSFVLFVVLLVSAAYAESVDDFIERWNKAAYIYGAPELVKDNMLEEDDSYTFTGEDWEVVVDYSYGTIEKVVSSSANTNRFLALCAITGVAVVRSKTADMLMQYDGIILNNYLRMESGEKSRSAVFGSYMYHLDKSEDRYLFIMEKQ